MKNPTYIPSVNLTGAPLLTILAAMSVATADSCTLVVASMPRMLVPSNTTFVDLAGVKATVSAWGLSYSLPISYVYQPKTNLATGNAEAFAQAMAHLRQLAQTWAMTADGYTLGLEEPITPLQGNWAGCSALLTLQIFHQ